MHSWMPVPMRYPDAWKKKKKKNCCVVLCFGARHSHLQISWAPVLLDEACGQASTQFNGGRYTKVTDQLLCLPRFGDKIKSKR